MNSRKSLRANFLEHLHPYSLSPEAIRFRTTFCLGGSAFLLFLTLLVTGSLLLLFYQPTLQDAYPSIARIHWVIPFGKLIRSMHYWAGQLMVLTIFGHMVRVFVSRAYAPPRQLNWVVGILLLVLTLFIDFTGYILRWDQETYAAAVVSLGILQSVPWIGPHLYSLILGGNTLTDISLIRIYVLHSILLPGLLILAIFYHFWRVRRDGITPSL